ncbi:MAG: hypothetical protein ACREJC_05770 [Tepidisphaeraceae bacterium]
MSRYSAAEVFKIGFFCEQRTGFHIHEDLCHLRIVGADGRTLPAGQVGEIVVTNLVNRASVLLNYRIGDVGSIRDLGCPCGRTFRLLSELEGRVEDIMPLPGGRFVHPRAMWEVFQHHPQVLQYQVVQHEIQRFELRLVTANETAFQDALEQIMPALQRVFGADAKINASRLSEFIRTEGVKFRVVTSMVNRRSSAPDHGS